MSEPFDLFDAIRHHTHLEPDGFVDANGVLHVQGFSLVADERQCWACGHVVPVYRICGICERCVQCCRIGHAVNEPEVDEEASLAGRYAEACAYVEELREKGADVRVIREAELERQQIWREYQAAQIDSTDELDWDDDDEWPEDEEDDELTSDDEDIMTDDELEAAIDAIVTEDMAALRAEIEEQ